MMKRSRRRSITLKVSDCLEPFSAVAVVDEQPRQIEQPRHPRDDGNDVQRLDPAAAMLRRLASASAHQLHQPRHVLRRRLRHDAVAEVEDEAACRPAPSEFRRPAAPSPLRRPPAAADRGCPARPPCRASASAHELRAAWPCRSPRHRRPSPRHSPLPARPRPRGKPMIGTSGCCALSRCDHAPGRRHHPALELRRRQGSPPSCRKSAATSAPAATWPDR